jgi:hypothetical protein
VGIGCEDGGIEDHEPEGREESKDRGSMLREGVIFTWLAQPHAIERAQALRPNEHARDGPIDLPPGGEGVPLLKREAQNHRRVDVRDHR